RWVQRPPRRHRERAPPRDAAATRSRRRSADSAARRNAQAVTRRRSAMSGQACKILVWKDYFREKLRGGALFETLHFRRDRNPGLRRTGPDMPLNLEPLGIVEGAACNATHAGPAFNGPHDGGSAARTG